VLAGGRYDGLIEALGGPETPGVGWAAGIERLAMLVDAPQEEKPHAVLIPMGDAAERVATGLLADLRRAGIAADMGFRGNMKKRMQRANASGAAFAVIIGDDELAQGEAAVKNLINGEQHMVALDKVSGVLGGN
jgi:histidyl-tRNA synthetase